MSALPIREGPQRPSSLLVDLKETARLLSVSVVTIRRVIKRGELRTVRLGNLVRVSREDITELIERKRSEQNR